MRGPFWPCGPCRQSYPKALRGENWWQVARAQVVAIHQSEDKPSPDGDVADTAHNLSVAYSFFQPRASGRMARNLWLFECNDSLFAPFSPGFFDPSHFFFSSTQLNCEFWKSQHLQQQVIHIHDLNYAKGWIFTCGKYSGVNPIVPAYHKMWVKFCAQVLMTDSSPCVWTLAAPLE